jgi:hypothetical protein
MPTILSITQLTIRVLAYPLLFFLAPTMVSAQCSGLGSITFSVVDLPEPTLDFNNFFCGGQQTTISVNESFAAYSWNTGQNTKSITVGLPGTYIVTVTNFAGCEGTASATVSVLPAPNFTISSLPYLCNGALTLIVGGAFVEYEWSNGETGPSITVLSSELYSVTVTDDRGCTSSQVFDAIIPDEPQVSISGDLFFCDNSNTVLTASQGFVSYQWSGGITNGNNVSVSVVGDYTVTVTDVFGCTASETVTVGSLPAPVPQVNQPDPICNGSSAIIQVANPIFQSYSWSNGANGPTISVTSPGDYILTVTDSNGCSGTVSSTLFLNADPVVFISQLPYQCDGFVLLEATSGFQQYFWSNGVSNSAIFVDREGDYVVTVTDANGCTGTALASAVIPASPQVLISGTPNICAGSNTILTATPGFSSYFWSSGQSDNSISVNTTGTYFVTVSDNAACTGTASFNVTIQPPPLVQITGPSQICSGSNAVFTARGGNFNSYIWSNNSQTSSITVSNPGNYSVTVTDSNGCTGTASVNLLVGSSLSINLIELAYQCNGELVLDAGAGFQTYNWSSGSTSQLDTLRFDGMVTVTVTDASGCTGEATATVMIPNPPQVFISGPIQLCTGELALLSATPGFLNYLWSNGQINSDITVSMGGAYSLVVTDDYGCQASSNFFITENDGPQPFISGTSVICPNSTTILSALGEFENWEWSTGQTTPQIIVSDEGVYVVTVTDMNGCKGTNNFTVTIQSELQPQISIHPYECDSLLTLDAGGNFLTYTWSNGGTDQRIIVSQNGVYEVTVTDGSACTGTARISVTIPNHPLVSIGGIPFFCSGNSTTLSASTGFQFYLWSSGATGTEIEVTQPGIYVISATDLNGCTSIDSISVEEKLLPEPQITGNTNICKGTSITLTASDDFPFILWSTGESSRQISVSSSSIIGLQVTDINGCSGTTFVVVTDSDSLSIQISALDYACDASLTLDAGFGFLFYEWSSGETSQTIAVSQSGNYQVTVSDSGGCTGTSSFFANVPEISFIEIVSPPRPVCPGETVQLFVTPGFVDYSWSTGDSSSAITVATSGIYEVTVTDLYGCQSTASFVFVYAESPEFRMLGNTLDCNTTEALVELDFFRVSGVPTFQWSNGASSASIITLQPGVVSVTVTDENGCTSIGSIEIQQDFIISSFIDTVEFVRGQMLQLIPPEVNFLPNSISWSPNDMFIGCMSCPVAQLRPTEEMVIRYEATSVAGCVHEGFFILLAAGGLKPSVFAPTAFSPGGQFNPSFTLFGNELVLQINYLKIFSRWGDAVFVGENLQLGDLSSGWDGSFRGQAVGPGVFSWMAEVQFANGNKKMFMGEVTVIR